MLRTHPMESEWKFLFLEGLNTLQGTAIKGGVSSI